MKIENKISILSLWIQNKKKHRTLYLIRAASVEISFIHDKGHIALSKLISLIVRFIMRN